MIFFAASRANEWRTDPPGPQAATPQWEEIVAEYTGIMYEIEPNRLLEESRHRDRSFPIFIDYMRRQDKPAIWLAPVGSTAEESYTDNLMAAYEWMKTEGLLPDIIVPINYGNPINNLPEQYSNGNIPVDTFTGAINKLLRTILHDTEVPVNPDILIDLDRAGVVMEIELEDINGKIAS